jgi:hypothetical protein
MQLAKFLSVVGQGPGWRNGVPAVWNDEMRAALGDDLVKVGFGGVIELTKAGRDVLAQQK